MKKWLALGLVVAAISVAIAVLVTRPSSTSSTDPVVEDFRAVERRCIQAFNDGLLQQRANRIDELELSRVIEHDVLGPWRQVRARVAAAAVPPERAALYTTLRHYLDARQLAWEAYVAGLRARSDAEARPHYVVYHQRNAEAQADAQALGAMFRR